jgi:hypothetical protein
VTVETSAETKRVGIERRASEAGSSWNCMLSRLWIAPVEAEDTELTGKESF